MPIDKLVIKYDTRERINDRDSLMAGQICIDIYTILEALYEYDPEIITINYNKLKLVIRTEQDRKAMEMIAIGSRNGNYAYLTKITCNPLSFGLWSDFWQVIEAMNDTQNRYSPSNQDLILRRGRITRIDYACDYATDIMTIMRGLYIERGQSFYAYTDMDDENPYLEYFWQRGQFNSFRIGKKNKVVKIYDKRLEEINRIRNSRSTPEDIRHENLERLQALPPKTRIEVSLTERNIINRIWNRTGRNSGTRPAPTLGDLRHHLNTIIVGDRITRSRSYPFAGILLNDIVTRESQRQGREFHNRTNEARRTLSEVDMGGLINLYQRWAREGRFWQEHGNHFHIMHWNPAYQPTRVYAMLMRQWLGRENTFYSEGVPIENNRHLENSMRVTDRWPMELTRR
ncbi:MAG: hypothetical protein OEY94_08150 [Alphaproteobacteria bacterium]|nr:hypothetical protein [Alphaproteobacteria bacterium]